jgi:acetyl esterase/lipase
MALIHLHGGGFRGGSKAAVENKALAYARLGYVCIGLQYRLSAQARWPDQLEDVRSGVRWVRSHADELGIEPERIGLVGYSAGAHLALVATGTAVSAPDAGVAACVAYYPPADLGALRPVTVEALLGDAGAADQPVDPNPINHIGAGFAPTVLFHGLEDVTITPASSFRLLEALRAAGTPAELHTYHGVPHEFDRHPEFAAAAAAACDLFLDHTVINPRTYPAFGAAAPATAPSS